MPHYRTLWSISDQSSTMVVIESICLFVCLSIGTLLPLYSQVLVLARTGQLMCLFDLIRIIQFAYLDPCLAQIKPKCKLFSGEHVWVLSLKLNENKDDTSKWRWWWWWVPIVTLPFRMLAPIDGVDMW